MVDRMGLSMMPPIQSLRDVVLPYMQLHRYLDDHWWMHRPDLPLQTVWVSGSVGHRIPWRRWRKGWAV